MLEVAMDHDAHMASFCIETQDILRSRYAVKTNQVFPITELGRQFAVDEIDRDIPGLQIAFPLFDCLMCMYANAGKQAPIRVQCSKTPGFEAVLERGKVNAKPNKAINGYRLAVLYNAVDYREQKNNEPMHINLGEFEEASFYERIFPCGHFHEDETDKSLPISINRKWWSLAHMNYASELASSCGCR
jgi:hypothetical protein